MDFFVTTVVICVVLALGIVLIVKLQFKIPVDLDQVFEMLEPHDKEAFVQVRVFHKKILFLNKPELIHKMLKSDVCLEKPNMFYKFLSLDNGILVENGKKVKALSLKI